MAVALASLLASSSALADYPIASHRYLADPGSVVYDGRVYLYNSNDDDNPVEGGYQMKSIVCISSRDLKNWTDHGVVFSVPAGASWANNSWAPQPVARSGTIYLFFGNSASGVGVATSTNPIAGFKDAKGSYLVDANTPGASGPDSWLFDPGVLIDSDGQGYLAFGGNGESNARIIKLGSDLISVSGSAVSLSPKGFFEAAFMFKRNDRYYLAYSTNPANGLRIDYLTSSSPMSGYEYGGVIADQPPQNDDNNHASEFELNGKWYHAYHNRVIAKTAGIPPTYKRNLALEVLEFNADGSIKPVTYTTDGVPQAEPLNPYVRVEAETMNAQSGIETEVCSEGGMDVTEIGDGDWIKVRGVDFGSAGAKTFSARVASTQAGGAIELRLGDASGMLVGTCEVPSTGGAQMWSTISCDVSGATGVKDLTLKFTGGGFNVDYWQFTSTDGTVGGAGGSGGGGSGSSEAGSSGGGNTSAGGGPTGGVAPTAGRAGAGMSGTPTSGSPAGGASGGSSSSPSAGAPAAAAAESSGCACAVGASGQRPATIPLTWLAAGLLALRVRARRHARVRGKFAPR